MDAPSERVVRVPGRRSDAGAWSLVGAVGLFLMIAIAKPWGSGATGIPSLGQAPAEPNPRTADTPAQATPLAAPSVGPGELACDGTGWQVVSIDRMAGWTVRTWTPATPVTASGPGDPTIPTLRLESPEVVSLGVCGASQPGGASGAAALRVVDAWEIRTGVPQHLAVATAQLASRDPRVARLYAPASSVGKAIAWSKGRFVLELAPFGSDSTGLGWDGTPLRWFIGVSVPGPT
jgi:hypothetical protein